MGKRSDGSYYGPTDDPRTELERKAQDVAQQALQSAEEGGGMHRPSKAYPGTKTPKKKANLVRPGRGRVGNSQYK